MLAGGRSQMSTFTRIDMETLQSRRDQNDISIYMPTHPRGVNGVEDRKRLDGLLNQIEKQLRDSGLDELMAAKLLAPARVTMKFDSFWNNFNEGLAMYIGPETARYYCVPIHFEELVVVSDHFILDPMLPLLENGQTAG